jgi:hypothetical protein
MAALASPGDLAAWRAVGAGLCLSLVGIKLARFACAPLFPALIAASRFRSPRRPRSISGRRTGRVSCRRARRRRARGADRRRRGVAGDEAAAAYVFSLLCAQTGGAYRLPFGLGAGALVLALAIDLAVAAGRRQACGHP